VADNAEAPQPSEGDRASAAHEHSATPYVLVWVALLFFTALTYFTGRAHLGTWALPIALAIATTKALLVALFFMHLWEQRGPSRLVLAVSAAFVVLLIGITISDVATRFELATPRGAPFGSRLELTHAQPGDSTAGSPAGLPAHDGEHPGFVAPSERSLKRERSAQDPSRP
jgi:cytochrome c oxidase subunit 4